MLMTLMCLLVFSCPVLAAGTTVTTFTPFADMDFAAQGYMDIVTAWEEETGNIVEDYSGLQDDLFLQQMTDMVSGGTADIVVVPVGSGLTGLQWCGSVRQEADRAAMASVSVPSNGRNGMPAVFSAIWVRRL